MSSTPPRLNTLEIIHPYGDVGELKTPLQGNGTPFGGGDEDLESFNDAALANRIRTYTEVKDDEARENIDALVQDAETWIFLGFAFHEQNLRLIKSGGTRLAKAKRVYATALGMSDSDVNITPGRILDFFTTASQVPLKLHLDQSIHDFTCAKLFDYLHPVAAELALPPALRAQRATGVALVPSRLSALPAIHRPNAK